MTENINTKRASMELAERIKRYAEVLVNATQQGMYYSPNYYLQDINELALVIASFFTAPTTNEQAKRIVKDMFLYGDEDANDAIYILYQHANGKIVKMPVPIDY